MTREELWARVHAARGAFYGGDPLYRAETPSSPLACVSCGGRGMVTVVLGPGDETAVPCPMCPAGDAVAEARIGRSWRADERGVA